MWSMISRAGPLADPRSAPARRCRLASAVAPAWGLLLPSSTSHSAILTSTHTRPPAVIAVAPAADAEPPAQPRNYHPDETHQPHSSVCLQHAQHGHMAMPSRKLLGGLSRIITQGHIGPHQHPNHARVSTRRRTVQWAVDQWAAAMHELKCPLRGRRQDLRSDGIPKWWNRKEGQRSVNIRIALHKVVCHGQPSTQSSSQTASAARTRPTPARPSPAGALAALTSLADVTPAMRCFMLSMNLHSG